MHHIVLHIGTHKTGTTSFQNWLERNADALAAERFHVYPYEGALKISAACIRDECADIPPLYGNPDWQQRRAALHAECKAEVAAFLDRRPQGTTVISCEHLSFFRTERETSRLRSLFPETADVSVILVLRDKDAFLRSYRNQVIKISASRLSYDKASPYYCRRDTWLTDFESIRTCFEKEFGDIAIVEYNSSDIIARLADAVGMQLKAEPQEVRTNSSTESGRGRAIEILYDLGLIEPVKLFVRGFRHVQQAIRSGKGVRRRRG